MRMNWFYVRDKIPELIYMIDILHDELAKVGLRENGAKTKLLTTCAINLPTNTIIKDETVDVRHHGFVRQIFRGKFGADLTKRGRIGLEHRLDLACAIFNQFNGIFMNKHVGWTWVFFLKGMGTAGPHRSSPGEVPISSGASIRSQWALPDAKRSFTIAEGLCGLQPSTPSPGAHCRTPPTTEDDIIYGWNAAVNAKSTNKKHAKSNFTINRR